jgi:hypothetical protein
MHCRRSDQLKLSTEPFSFGLISLYQEEVREKVVGTIRYHIEMPYDFVLAGTALMHASVF